MTIKRTLLLAGATVALLLIGDAPRDAGTPFGLQLVTDAHAIFGVRRRTARRWFVVGASAGAAAASASHDSDSDDADNDDSGAQQQAPTAPPPASGGEPLPIGTVADSLPPGCTSTPVGGKQYYYCAGNFYRAVLQGNRLVYVTAKP